MTLVFMVVDQLYQLVDSFKTKINNKMKNVIKKTAYAIQMSYDVSDEEKLQAEKALMCFNYALKLLNTASDHLDIMKTPFKDNPGTSPDELMRARAAVRRFRDKVIDNFNQFKITTFKCVNIMQIFSSDTQTLKLMKALISSVDNLETKVNDFADLFNDLESNDFSKSVVMCIESIQKQCEEIDKLIDERIKSHIQSNILAKSWVNSVSDNLQMSIQKNTPLILDLFNKRQDQLNDLAKNKP